jgi:hypothetical protein
VKSYRFRLATVARVRALEERMARERYLTSLRTSRQREAAYHEAHEALVDEAPLWGVVTPAELRWSQDQAERQARVERELLARWRAAKQVNEADRDAWREAAKRARALERLDERARVEWLAEYRREEALELDDLSNARYVPTGRRS